MHMSSACPRGRTPGQPEKYVGEYKRMDTTLFFVRREGCKRIPRLLFRGRQPQGYYGDLSLYPNH